LTLFSKELLSHFDEVQALVASYTFSEISGIQALMGFLSVHKGGSQVKTLCLELLLEKSWNQSGCRKSGVLAHM
jgi:hypothetical protein